MGIYGVYIVSKSGGLIFNYDYTVPKIETEQTFSYPLDLKLSYENNRLLVSFGQRDNIKGITQFLTSLVCYYAINHVSYQIFTVKRIVLCSISSWPCIIGSQWNFCVW